MLVDTSGFCESGNESLATTKHKVCATTNLADVSEEQHVFQELQLWVTWGGGGASSMSGCLTTMMTEVSEYCFVDRIRIRILFGIRILTDIIFVHKYLAEYEYE